MELYGRNSGRESTGPDPPSEWGAGGGGDTGLEESMWRMGLSGRESYPERPGVSECMYYMRTGFCGFGPRCRYNHPPDRAADFHDGQIVAAVRMGGEYPERPGEPVCQYYLKTGTCKFGATCKFHHPRNAGGSIPNAPLNYQGYPLRPGEQECSYYLKMGQCKFGATCKFHHPQPSGMLMPAAASPFYPTVQSPNVPMPEQAAGSSASYRMPQPPVMPGSYVPGTYGHVLLSPGVVPVPGWSSYSGPLSPVASPGAQPAGGPGSMYGVSPLSPSTPGVAGSYSVMPSSIGLAGSGIREHNFPERPGEPECQYYMKTGNCKFGPSCKYHHPADRAASAAFLGPLGLPLRLVSDTLICVPSVGHFDKCPKCRNKVWSVIDVEVECPTQGTQPCSFYMQNGYCKFGPTCKFDHPVGMMKYNPASSVGLTYVQTSPINLQQQRPGQDSAVFSTSKSMGGDDEIHVSS